MAPEPDDLLSRLFHWLAVLPPGDRMVAVMFVLMAIAGIVIVVVTVLAVQWRRVRQAEVDAALKRDMLERGMSAADIERVVQASSRRRRRSEPGA